MSSPPPPAMATPPPSNSSSSAPFPFVFFVYPMSVLPVVHVPTVRQARRAKCKLSCHDCDYVMEGAHFCRLIRCAPSAALSVSTTSTSAPTVMVASRSSRKVRVAGPIGNTRPSHVGQTHEARVYGPNAIRAETIRAMERRTALEAGEYHSC